MNNGSIEQFFRQVWREVRHRLEVGSRQTGYGVEIHWLNAWAIVEHCPNRFERCVIDQDVEILTRRNLGQRFKPTQHGMPYARSLQPVKQSTNTQLMGNESTSSVVRPRSTHAKCRQPRTSSTCRAIDNPR